MEIGVACFWQNHNQWTATQLKLYCSISEVVECRQKTEKHRIGFKMHAKFGNFRIWPVLLTCRKLTSSDGSMHDNSFLISANKIENQISRRLLFWPFRSYYSFFYLLNLIGRLIILEKKNSEVRTQGKTSSGSFNK